MEFKVNLDPGYLGIDQPIGYYCPNSNLEVLRRYRHALQPEAQATGALARAAYQPPPLPSHTPARTRGNGRHIEIRAHALYRHAVEADRATFGGPCTLRPLQIVDHAVAVIDQLRWYRNFGRSDDARTLHIDALAPALIDLLATMGAHLWVVGRLVRDELCPNAFLGGYGLGWTDQLIRYVDDLHHRSRHALDGCPLERITGLQCFHNGYPPPVEAVFTEIERLMNELLLPFKASIDAKVCTGLRSRVQGCLNLGQSPAAVSDQCHLIR